MNKKSRIIFTATSDLATDQRMQRICEVLSKAGFQVLLLGVNRGSSLNLPFPTKQINCFFKKGLGFYAEYNLRLFFFLLFAKMEAVCSIDLDTILAASCLRIIRPFKHIYDAHEYFTESPEIQLRPKVKAFWSKLALKTVPKVDLAYTVCQSIADILKEEYNVEFNVIRNLPIDRKENITQSTDGFLLYQGVLNVGRGLEELIHAMGSLPNHKLKIAGSGDIEEKLKSLATALNVNHRVEFLGKLEPQALRTLTGKAYLGFNLLDKGNLNYYYSLANKFFDYMQCGVPSIGMNFPEYKLINDQYQFALLIDDLNENKIVEAVGVFDSSLELHSRMCANAKKASEKLNWENESKKLILLYTQLFV